MKTSSKRRPRNRAATGARDFVLFIEREAYERVTVRLAALLPAILGYAIAVWRANIRYHLDSSSRSLLSYDLEKVLRDQSPEDRIQLVKCIFRERSCQKLDTIRISKNLPSFLQLVDVRGRENIESALHGGKGAILCSAHFGNSLNCVAVIGALGYRVTAITRWSFKISRDNSLRRRLIPGLVGRDNIAHLIRSPIESRRNDLSPAVQAALLLRRNELVFTNIDVPIRAKDLDRSVKLNLLNKEVNILPGAVSIAKLTGAPLLITLIHRSPDWRHQVVEISSPVPTDADTATVLQRCLAFLDAAIRREPAQWFYWGRPDLPNLGLLPEDLARYQRPIHTASTDR